MPLYRVQLKQGKRTITNHIEAKNITACLGFFNEITTMKVSEILEVKYVDDTHAPIDDFNYFSVFKGFLKNSTNMAKQIVVNNVKLTKNESEIAMACKTYLDVGGLSVQSITSSLFKR